MICKWPNAFGLVNAHTQGLQWHLALVGRTSGSFPRVVGIPPFFGVCPRFRMLLREIENLLRICWKYIFSLDDTSCSTQNIVILWYLYTDTHLVAVHGARIQLPHTLKQAGWGRFQLQHGDFTQPNIWVWRRTSGIAWVWDESSCKLLAVDLVELSHITCFFFWCWILSEIFRQLVPKVVVLLITTSLNHGQEVESHVVENTPQKELKSWDSQRDLAAWVHNALTVFKRRGYRDIPKSSFNGEHVTCMKIWWTCEIDRPLFRHAHLFKIHWDNDMPTDQNGVCLMHRM